MHIREPKKAKRRHKGAEGSHKERNGGQMPPKALIWALITATLIASYTVIDGIGVRASENPLSYIVWLFILEVVPIGTILLITKRPEWTKYFLEKYL